MSLCCKAMLSVAMQIIVMLSAILLSVIMLGVIIICFYTEFLYAEQNVYITTLGRTLFYFYADCSCAEHHYVECHYAV